MILADHIVKVCGVSVRRFDQMQVAAGLLRDHAGDQLGGSLALTILHHHTGRGGGIHIAGVIRVTIAGEVGN